MPWKVSIAAGAQSFLLAMGPPSIWLPGSALSSERRRCTAAPAVSGKKARNILLVRVIQVAGAIPTWQLTSWVGFDKIPALKLNWIHLLAKPSRLARIFKVLSVDTRVRLVQLLKERALCVNALAARLQISPAAVSQHLRILRDAELVVPEKRGYYVHYRINEKTLVEWREMADKLLSSEAG